MKMDVNLKDYGLQPRRVVTKAQFEELKRNLITLFEYNKGLTEGSLSIGGYNVGQESGVTITADAEGSEKVPVVQLDNVKGKRILTIYAAKAPEGLESVLDAISSVLKEW